MSADPVLAPVLQHPCSDQLRQWYCSIAGFTLNFFCGTCIFKAACGVSYLVACIHVISGLLCMINCAQIKSLSYIPVINHCRRFKGKCLTRNVIVQ